jgi:SagB-type dehydrogenase family enzyme
MKRGLALFVLLAALPVIFAGCGAGEVTSTVSQDTVKIVLPEPRHGSDTSIEEALLKRRSVRDFSGEAVTLAQLGQLLWAGQGITDPTGKRTAPSAGALYPLTLYAVVGNVEGVDPGVYKYEPATHSLQRVVNGDKRQALARAALGQECVGQGAIDIVITAVYEITTVKYGTRGLTYVHLEAGHAAQNICLQAVGLELGAVTIGAFDDEDVKKTLNLADDEVPLYIIPAGNPVA